MRIPSAPPPAVRARAPPRARHAGPTHQNLATGRIPMIQTTHAATGPAVAGETRPARVPAPALPQEGRGDHPFRASIASFRAAAGTIN